MPVPVWRRDFPYEAAGEDEVTRREFARYLVLGAGAMAAGNVALAAWTQLRSINTGEPRAIVAVDDVTSVARSCSVTPGDDDPAVLLRLGERESWRSARSAPTSAASSTSSPTRTAGTARATRGTSTPAPGRSVGPAHLGARPIDVEIRDDGMIWALGRSE